VRKILTTGLIAVFLIGIVYFFFRVLVLDIITPLFNPILVHVTDKDYFQIPLAIIFTAIVVMIIGWILTKFHLQNIYDRYLRRVPINLERARGALVMLGPDTYFLALIIKEINLQRLTGKPEKYYVLYGPSSPLPWSGLPILYVKKDRVIVVKLSYGELYGISGSFGGTTPQLLEELKLGGFVDDLAGEEGRIDG
jgi:uncharacterized membrane protein